MGFTYHSYSDCKGGSYDGTRNFPLCTDYDNWIQRSSMAQPCPYRADEDCGDDSASWHRNHIRDVDDSSAGSRAVAQVQKVSLQGI